MQLTWSPEQEEFRAAVRAFLEAKSPVTKARELSEGDEPYDPAVWKQLAEQLGLPSLAVPEELGGAGAGLAEQLIALEEMGRVLYSGPFLASMAAGVAIAAGDDTARERYLPGLADGSLIASVAEAEGETFFDLSTLATVATAVAGDASTPGSSVRVSGRKQYVLDGEAADLLVVSAATPQGPVLVVVERPSAGLEVARTKTLDRTRRLAGMTFADVQGTVLVGPGDVGSAMDGIRRICVAGLAAEQLGGAERCLEMVVEYSRLRQQFDRPIGSFQALKHRCADVLIAVEGTRSAILYAAWAATEEVAELDIATSVAGAQASATFLQSAQECMQMHGGIGFTWEHDAHLYLRRAKSAHVMFGSPAQHRARLAALISL